MNLYPPLQFPRIYWVSPTFVRQSGEAVHLEWRRLVVTYGVMGVKVYDARLVALMLVYGVTNILTFNTDDFKRFSQITVVHPSEIAPEQVQD
jgi:predicted nucleic acid-binding protein